MTKRFTVEDNCVGYYTEIIDTKKELDLKLDNPKKNLTIEELVKLLNNLAEENEQLKKAIESNNIDIIKLIDRTITNTKESEGYLFTPNEVKVVKNVLLGLKKEILYNLLEGELI